MSLLFLIRFWCSHFKNWYSPLNNVLTFWKFHFKIGKFSIFAQIQFTVRECCVTLGNFDTILRYHIIFYQANGNFCNLNGRLWGKYEGGPESFWERDERCPIRLYLRLGALHIWTILIFNIIQTGTYHIKLGMEKGNILKYNKQIKKQFTAGGH